MFHSPVNNLYGWNTSWRKPYYLNKQLKQATNNYKLLFSSSTLKEMDEALTKANLINSFPSDIFRERICIYDCKKNQFMSVFYHIRNAFAHGRFDFRILNNEEYFILEDVKKGKKDSTDFQDRIFKYQGMNMNQIPNCEAIFEEFKTYL